MPHKRNPVLAENLTGLARIARGAVIPAMENVALWHERDISHSSVERVIAPDTTIALDFALARLAELVSGMTVYRERIRENLNALGGLHFSQRVLLALTQAGVSREDAYRLVQKNAMEVWDGLQKGKKVDFKSKLLSDKTLAKHLTQKELAACFDERFYIRHAKKIWKRVLEA
jgi:adenylosuccinate lyase